MFNNQIIIHQTNTELNLLNTHNYPKLIVFISLILSFFSLSSNATGTSTSLYGYRHWGAESELPQSSVNAIIQSTDGYLWIGTYGGLVRFDGVTFEHIAHPLLNYERIISLFEDTNHNIWIGSENNGVYRYKDGEVTHFKLGEGFAGRGVTSIFQTQNNSIGILIQGTGLAFIIEDSVKYTNFKPFEGALLEQALIDKSNTIWVISTSGVHFLKTENATPVKIENSDCNKDGLAIFEGSDNQIYYMNQNGVYHIEKNTLQSNFLFSHNQEIVSRQFLISTNGNFWYATSDNTLYCQTSSKLLKWTGGIDLPNSDISCIFQDNTGNIWVGLNGGGLMQFFENQIRVLGDKNKIATAKTLAIHDDLHGSMWVGTNGSGFFKVNTATEEPEEWLPENGGPNHDIWSIATDNQGNLWAGTFGDGIYHWNLDSSNFPTQIEDWGGESQVILAMLYDSINQRLLIGSDQGGVFQHKNGSWKTLISDHLSQNRITQFVVSPSNQIYISTQGDGIKVLDLNEVRTINSESGLPFNSIRDIYFDTEGTMWLGTYGKGLIVELDHQFYVINKSNGLFDNLVSTINQDELGYLWMSCNLGVFRAKRTELIDVALQKRDKILCQIFNKSQGMGDSETNGGFQPSSIHTNSGYLLYPTMKGISIFIPKKIKPEPPLSHLQIPSVEYGDTTVLASENIILPKQFRDIIFNYTAPSYFSPELIQFEHKLEGYDLEWQSSGTNRFAKYTNLDPGNYNFMVRARNSQGILSTVEASLNVQISPYFYETKVFKISLGLFSVLLLLFLYFRKQQLSKKREADLKAQVIERTKDLQKEKELTEKALEKLAQQSGELEQMSKAKSIFFTNVSHELKTPLTLIKGPIESILENYAGSINDSIKEELTLVQRNSNQLNELISQLLDIARSEDGKLIKKEITTDVKLLVSDIITSFDSWFKQKDIKLNVNISEQKIIGVTDPGLLEKIISNLISNALKFTPRNGQIEIRLKVIDELLEFGISDSGKGINPNDLAYVFERFYKSNNKQELNASGSGIGLALVKEYTTLLGGEIHVESNVNSGACFYFQVPFKVGDTQNLTPKPSVAAPILTEVNETKTLISPSSLSKEEQEKLPLALVVDDHDEIRQFIKRTLQYEYRILEAVNGEEGYEMAKEHLPDIIISDVMMPKVDGLELLQLLKSNSDTDFIAVLLLTARRSDETRIMGWQEGAEAYLSKPFNGKELLYRLQNILSNRKKLRAKVLLDSSVSIATTVTNKPEFEVQFEQLVSQNLANPDFSFADHLYDFALSRSSFQRKVNKVYLVSPQAYLKEQRLTRAKELIIQESGSIAEIAYACGFNSVSYFTRMFKNKYSNTPSFYQRKD